MAVTLTKIQCYSPTPALPAPPAQPRKNTPPNDHSSKRAHSLSSLHSKLLPSPVSQPEVHHSLPPRPPAVVPFSTTNRINGHSSSPKDFDRAYNGLVPVTGVANDKDGVSSICVPVKENTDRTCSRVTLPDQRSPWRTTPIAASADPTPSSTREQSRSRDQLDPSLEFGKSAPRAVHADRNLDSADPEIVPSVQGLSAVNRKHPLVTPPAASSAPSCSVSLRRSSTRTDLTPPDSGQSHWPDHIARDADESLGMLSLPIIWSHYPNGVLAAENRVVRRRYSQDNPVNSKGQACSSNLPTVGSEYNYNRCSTDGADSAIALDGILSHLSEEQSSGSITSEEPSPDSRVDPAVTVGDLSLLFSGETVGQSRENLQAGSDRYHLGRSSHTHAKSPPIASGSEQLGLDIEDSECVSDADDDAPGSGNRWEYRRIKARRIDSSGRKMAMVEWEDTWEPEDKLDGLKMALRRYARERQPKRDSEGTCPKCGVRKRKCPV